MFTIALDGVGSLQQQICRTLRDAIISGSLKPESRLSPSRTFAETHGVSRNTVIAAYEQLVAEGYLETRPGAGTFVIDARSKEPRATNKTELINKIIQPRWSSFADRVSKVPEQLLARSQRRKVRYDFLYGEPGYADLPIERWSRIVGRSARELTEDQLGYGDVAGLSKLREALAAYLGRARGVNCDASQIFIVHGTQDAIDLTVRAFVAESDQAVVEEPHYRGFARCLSAVGAEVVAVKVDENGLDTSQLDSIKDAKLALVTPSHQFPFGSVMTLLRRRELLAWAKRHRTVVLEDDYDGEFRYENKPIPSLQSLDDAGLVIYVGSASKMLFPSLRLGWMVVPKHMVSMFERLRSLSGAGSGILEQVAFSRFVAEGYLERHIHKVRRRHHERRSELLSVLKDELGDEVAVTGTDAGIHVLVRLLNIPARDTERVIALAEEQNVGVYSAELYYSKPPQQAELLLGYASLTPRQIRVGVKRLAGVVRDLLR